MSDRPKLEPHTPMFMVIGGDSGPEATEIPQESMTRITEEGDTRITEDGDTRVTEGI